MPANMEKHRTVLINGSLVRHRARTVVVVRRTAETLVLAALRHAIRESTMSQRMSSYRHAAFSMPVCSKLISQAHLVTCRGPSVAPVRRSWRSK
jgi:hypothetical protein